MGWKANGLLQALKHQLELNWNVNKLSPKIISFTATICTTHSWPGQLGSCYCHTHTHTHTHTHARTTHTHTCTHTHTHMHTQHTHTHAHTTHTHMHAHTSTSTPPWKKTKTKNKTKTIKHTKKLKLLLLVILTVFNVLSTQHMLLLFVCCRFVTIIIQLADDSISVGNLQGLRTFRVLRALKTVSIVPGKPGDIIYANLFCREFCYITSLLKSSWMVLK